MIKINYRTKIKRSACIAAAVFMLGACGNSAETGTAPASTASESTEAETSAQEVAAASEKASQESKTEAEKTNGEDQDKTDIEESSSKIEAEENSEENAEENADKDNSQEEISTASKQEESNEADASANAEKNSSDNQKDNQNESAETEEETLAQAESSASAQDSSKRINDIYSEIEQSVSLNSPMLVPDDFIMNYYGIDVSTLDEYVFSMSEAATSAETVVILKAKDAGDTHALSASLQTVIDQKRSEMENYLPDQFQIVDKSSVQVKGNYVYLVISEQADAISRIIQADIP